MALDTEKIEDYVKNNTDDFIKQVLFMFSSANHIKIRPGIKHKESFGRIATDILWQAGSCGWNPQGVTKLDDIELAVTPLKINENICQQDLDDTYYNLMGTAGSIADGEDFQLENVYVDEKVRKAAASLEKHIWRGNTASSDQTINKFDGFIKKIKADIPNARTGSYTAVADVSGQPYVMVTTAVSHGLEDGQSVTLSAGTPSDYDGTYEIHNVKDTSFYIQATFTATATGTWTEVADQRISRTGSVLADVKSLMNAMPDEFYDLEELKCYMNTANYRSLVQELVDLGSTGNFHVDLTKPTDSFFFPGEDVEIVKTKGMKGDNTIVLTFRENLWMGTDLVNDFETVKFFYDEGEDTHKLLMKVKAGTKVALPHFVAIAE